MNTVGSYRVSVQVRDGLDCDSIHDVQHHEMNSSPDGKEDRQTLVLLASDLNLVRFHDFLDRIANVAQSHIDTSFLRVKKSGS